MRGGDRVTFLDGTTQTCTWDEGNYQNFGPARLPSVHHDHAGLLRKAGCAAAGGSEHDPLRLPAKR